METCPQCERTLDRADARFCSECGARVTPHSSPVSADEYAITAEPQSADPAAQADGSELSLAGDDTPALARDTTSTDALERLATSAQPGVRAEVAGNSSTSEDTLALLSNDEDEQVRYFVGTNANTPAFILERLASDTSTFVRTGVARNGATPTLVLDIFAADASALVSATAGANPSRHRTDSDASDVDVAPSRVAVVQVPNRQGPRVLSATPVLPGFRHWRLLGMSDVLRHFAQCTSNLYMSAGYALTVNGSVLKWETRTALVSAGQDEVYESVRFPTRTVENLGRVLELVGGTQGDSYGSVFVLSENGDVWAWGETFYADAGIEGSDFEEPVRLHEPRNVTSLVASEDGSTRMALTADGRVWAWGSNYGGLLGDGTVTDRAMPAELDGLDDIAAVSIQPWGATALGVDGSIWTWGHDPFDDDADDLAEDGLLPARVHGLPAMIALGGGRTAIDEHGSVWTWDRTSPGRRVLGITGALEVVYGKTRRDFGEEYALGEEPGETYHAVTDDGRVWAWGANDGGQVGNGSTVQVPSPQLVPGLDHVSALVAWDSLRYALTDDGTVQAWGGVGGKWQSSSEGTEVSDVYGTTPRAITLPPVRDAEGPVKWGALKVTGLGSEELRQQFWDLREGRTMLMICAAAGLDDEVELMIEQGAELNSRDEDGDTALFYAASKGNTSTVEILLNAGADPNLAASDNGSPLEIAANAALSAWTGQPLPSGRTGEHFRSTVMTLLRGGADPAPMLARDIEVVRPTERGMLVIRPEHLGDYLGFDDLALALRDPRAQRDAATVHAEIARGYASIDQAVADQRAFQSRSLYSEFYSSTGQWGLHAAATRADVVEWLRAGAPINGVAKIDYGDNRQHWEVPLLTAFIDGHFEAAIALIECGADVDAPNAIVLPDGSVLNHTTLHMVTQRGDNAAASRLIAAGADVNRQTTFGTTSLHFAAGEDNYDLVVMLLRAGANPHVREFDKDRPGGFGDLPIDQAGPTTVPLLR